MAQPIDPRQLRPRRRWYGVAIFIAVLFIALGIGGMTIAYLRTENTYPDFQTYSGKEPSLIEIAPRREYALYVPENASWICTIDSETVKPLDEEPLEFTRDGQRWVHVETMVSRVSGTYSVQCEAPTFGFGDPPPYNRYRLQLGSGVAALLGLPCLGLTICFVLALVTGLRRGRHKLRLQAARTATTPNSGPLDPTWPGSAQPGPGGSTERSTY
ncbi:hypothetical protein [Cryptosporangium minutisporangium]|uniref:DUF3592 domain-containing protein n=1 Tax=Cryptosporangium minutisporangium TaxID=113569 RepID=A0ABP6SZ44_9ACTN